MKSSGQWFPNLGAHQLPPVRFLKIQILGTYPHTSKFKILGVGPRNPQFYKLLRQFLCSQPGRSLLEEVHLRSTELSLLYICDGTEQWLSTVDARMPESHLQSI